MEGRLQGDPRGEGACGGDPSGRSLRGDPRGEEACGMTSVEKGPEGMTAELLMNLWAQC